MPQSLVSVHNTGASLRCAPATPRSPIKHAPFPRPESMFTIRPFALADIPAGMRLKRLAGWNQTEADWRRAVALEPNGCYAGLVDGEVVATLTTCVFGPVAWIAMVLTDPAFRGRGFASRLLERALADLRERGAETVRLDATDLGRPVYEKFGFAVDFALQRWNGDVAVTEAKDLPTDTTLRESRADDSSATAELDRRASGCDRSEFLTHLLADASSPGLIAESMGAPVGFALQRSGEHATQLGPLAATNESIAEALLRHVLHRSRGMRMFVDVKSGALPFDHVLRGAGLDVQRTFLRMTLGRKLADADALSWVSSGPEKG
ncbi:MAG: GNAT family N-acetyltransferase [Pirellula sp.]|nr:GNAT family N-acetyltransferase [Pirellula sp.]